MVRPSRTLLLVATAAACTVGAADAAAHSLPRARPAAAAGFTVTLGPRVLPPLGSSGSGSGCALANAGSCSVTFMPTALGSGEPVLPPADGTIVSWAVLSSPGTTGGGSFRLRVIRPEPGGNVTAAASTAPVTKAQANRDELPASLPVVLGDKIAISTDVTTSNPSGGAADVELIPGSSSTQVAFNGPFADSELRVPPAPSTGLALEFHAVERLDLPAVTAIAPVSGPPTGGTRLTITGSHLANPAGVTVGGVAATILSATNTEVVAVAPPGAAGQGADVLVTTIGGTSAVASGAVFTYSGGARPPALSALRISPRTFAVARAATPLDGVTAGRTRPRPARGTTISFSLDGGASVTVALQRVAAGRRVGSRCAAPRRGSRGRRCTRLLAAGTLRRAGHAGANAISFSGRVGRRALAPGSYRATVVAATAAGRSRAGIAAFTVVRG